MFESEVERREVGVFEIGIQALELSEEVAQAKKGALAFQDKANGYCKHRKATVTRNC